MLSYLICFFFGLSGLPGTKIFSEDFSNNDRNWRYEYANLRTTQLENGQYVHIGANNKSTCFSNQLILLDTDKDFFITLNAKHLSGALDQSYGFTFGNEAPDRDYTLMITADGQFSVSDHKQPIIDWTVHAALHPRHTENNIAIWKQGDSCRIFFNEIKAASIQLSNLQRKDHFFLGLVTAGKQKVAYDDIEVYGTSK